MNRNRVTLATIIFIAALIATACGGTATPSEPTPDVAAVRTSAASTVVSQFTLTAAAFTPVPQPSPAKTEVPVEEATATETQPAVAVITNEAGTPVELCDSMGYDLATVDVTVPDGTIMSPGQDFIKTWKIKNTGACPWGAGYSLVYAGYSNRMSGQFAGFKEVIQPGQEVEVSVQFTAPNDPGEYLSAWQMQNPKGVTFPEIVFVKIVVQ